MNNLKVKLRDRKMKDLLIQIDGQTPQFKKGENGIFETNFETEKNTVSIKIFKCMEIQSKFWFLWQMLFFFISIFGIFNKRLDKKCVVIDSEFVVSVSENSTIEFSLRHTTKSDLIQFATIEKISVVKNISFVDNKLKKRMKILKLTKIFTILALIILSITLLIFLS